MSKRKKNKEININRDKFFYSPNLLDLRQREVDVIAIEKKPTWWAKLKSKFNLKKDDDKSVDFADEIKNSKITKKISKKVVNQVNEWDLPPFVDNLLYSKKSRAHVALERVGFKFEKHPLLNKIGHALIFILIALVLLLPVQGVALVQKFTDKKDEIMSHSWEGYEYFKKAQMGIELGDFISAQESFRQAENEFELAKKELGIWRVFIPLSAKFIEEISAYYLIESAQLVAQTGDELTSWVINLKNDLTLSEINSEDLDFGKVLSRVSELAESRQNLEDRIMAIEANLAKVDPSVLDPDQVAKIEPIKNEALRFLDILEILPDFLGQGDLRSYLVIFQNSNEIRATGGFIGSLARIDVMDGKITKIDIPGGGSYDLRAGFKDNLQAPQPMWRVNERWEMQDVNWWPDFPTSAKKIAWFYENSDQPTVDGVIAINSDILPSLLEIYGSIYLSEYNQTITAQNFYELTQREVELNYNKQENKPKQFVADLFFVMLDDLTSSFSFQEENQLKFISGILQEIDEALRVKDIQIYLRNEEFQDKIAELEMSGEIKATDRDYLMVVNTNIGGGKTDKVVDQKIDLITEVQEDNSIVNTLKVTRRHDGDRKDIFARMMNKDYMRIYLPKGSTIIESDGFTDLDLEKDFRQPADYLKLDEDLSKVETNEYFSQNGAKIYEESGKTVFANWLDLPIGETKTVVVKYRLPFEFDENYSLLLQKQSGGRQVYVVNEVIVGNKKMFSSSQVLENDLKIEI